MAAFRTRTLVLALALGPAGAALLPGSAAAQSDRDRRLYDEVTQKVEARNKLTQVMVDKVFSFAELGFQEFETSRYLTDILRQNGFDVRMGVSGIPTAWWATWGSGDPVISIGSDIDGIPKASQKPGVAYRDPIVVGGPGHGEGHNTGVPLNITAALALKEVMEANDIEGTIALWPGVAEELLATKAWFVRDGLFRDVDAAIFTHVGNNLGTSWGSQGGTGLVSIEFTFSGESAHSAGAPWRGRSALDAVELMNAGWNYRREHLSPEQRSHYVISDGGDQPNVVPSEASVWYYIREIDYEDIRRNVDDLIKTAEGAALMTNTKVSHQILGTAWPRHFSKPITEAMGRHIQAVGLPQWSEEDQALARAVQKMLGNKQTPGLATKAEGAEGPPAERRGGGSDDIGDISWAVPTVRLGYPSNIPGLPGHNWSSAIASATPIAHKGATAGAKVVARTALELFLNPQLVQDAKAYFTDVQTKDTRYIPFIAADTPPAIWLNTETMAEFKPKLQPFYFDETKYDTYMEQLGIRYPTLSR